MVCVCMYVSIYLFSLAGHKNPSYSFVLFYLFCSDVSISTQIIKRSGEGIAAMDGVGCLAKGAYDMHCLIHIRKKHANQKAHNLHH